LAFTDAISHATVLRLRNYRLYVNVVTQGFRRTVSPEKRRSRVVQDLPGMVDDLVMAKLCVPEKSSHWDLAGQVW
jgi:hypothetical protein